MYFVIEARDFAGKLQVRQDTRPAHLEYLSELGDRLALAGPFLDDDGNPCGSLVIISADTLEEAEAIAVRDPYVAAGLFETSSVRPWKWAINAPETK